MASSVEGARELPSGHQVCGSLDQTGGEAVSTSGAKAAMHQRGTVTTGRASNTVWMPKNAKPCKPKDSTLTIPQSSRR
jgi:hypothetical protein